MRKLFTGNIEDWEGLKPVLKKTPMPIKLDTHYKLDQYTVRLSEGHALEYTLGQIVQEENAEEEKFLLNFFGSLENAQRFGRFFWLETKRDIGPIVTEEYRFQQYSIRSNYSFRLRLKTEEELAEHNRNLWIPPDMFTLINEARKRNNYPGSDEWDEKRRRPTTWVNG